MCQMVRRILADFVFLPKNIAGETGTGHRGSRHEAVRFGSLTEGKRTTEGKYYCKEIFLTGFPALRPRPRSCDPGRGETQHHESKS